LVLGLGNPGARYRLTRHNAGFWVVDYLSEALQIPVKRTFLKPYQLGMKRVNGPLLALAKPLTYMNRSGQVIEPLLKKTAFPLSSLLVVCDTLDLPPGIIRLRRRGSSAGHNGLKSIIAALQTEEFMRLYIGIGRPPTSGGSVVEHVLGEPTDIEQSLLKEAIERSGQAILRILDQGPEAVMNEINRK